MNEEVNGMIELDPASMIGGTEETLEKLSHIESVVHVEHITIVHRDGSEQKFEPDTTGRINLDTSSFLTHFSLPLPETEQTSTPRHPRHHKSPERIDPRYQPQFVRNPLYQNPSPHNDLITNLISPSQFNQLPSFTPIRLSHPFQALPPMITSVRPHMPGITQFFTPPHSIQSRNFLASTVRSMAS